MSKKRKLLARSGYSLAVTAAAMLVSAPSHAGGYSDHSQWTTAVTIPVLNSPVADGCPIESEDGLSLFIASVRPGGFGGNDIWAADRDSTDSPWGAPRNLGESINTASADFCPTPVMGRYL